MTLHMSLEPADAQLQGAGAEAGSQPMLCIAVSDSGRGMSPTEVARCFDAGHASSFNEGGGTGLGLYSAWPRLLHCLQRTHAFHPTDAFAWCVLSTQSATPLRASAAER